MRSMQEPLRWPDAKGCSKRLPCPMTARGPGDRVHLLCAAPCIDDAGKRALGVTFSERLRDDQRPKRLLDLHQARRWPASVSRKPSAHVEGNSAGRFDELDEFGAAVAFTYSDAASYMTGSVVRVDGGQTRTIL